MTEVFEEKILFEGYNGLSRFQVIEGPLQLAPNKCAGCATGEGQFIDWGLDLEFYGRVFICLSCFTEMGNQLGYFSNEQYMRLKNEGLRLVEAYRKLEEENRNLKDGLDSLNAAIHESVINSPVSSYDPGSFEESAESIEDVADSDDGDSEGSTGSNEQTDEPGSSDVSDNDSFDSLKDLI